MYSVDGADPGHDLPHHPARSAGAVRPGGLLALPSDHANPRARHVVPVFDWEENASVDRCPVEAHSRGPRYAHYILSEDRRH